MPSESLTGTKAALRRTPDTVDSVHLDYAGTLTHLMQALGKPVSVKIAAVSGGVPHVAEFGGTLAAGWNPNPDIATSTMSFGSAWTSTTVVSS